METAARPRTADRKRDRLKLSVSEEQRHILHEAAAASGMSLDAFVVSRATAAAHDLLADFATVRPAEERWGKFLSMLERGSSFDPS